MYVERLEGDEGLKRVMEEAEVYGLGRRERQALGNRNVLTATGTCSKRKIPTGCLDRRKPRNRIT